MNKLSDWALLRRALAETKGYRNRIAAIWVLRLLSSPLGLLMPLPLKVAVDSAVGNRPLPGFLQIMLPTAIVESRSAIVGLAAVLMLLIFLKE